MFKSEISEINKYKLDAGEAFSWLLSKRSHQNNMGIERSTEIAKDLNRLEQHCIKISIDLPIEFVRFMKSAHWFEKFRSFNAGFFDIRDEPVKCPISEGYLIPFITDQQYCHYYFLHVTPDTQDYLIVWTDDLYYGAMYASQEEFDTEYKEEFDKNDIYLCDDNFEHFMLCHYKTHEKYHSDNGF